jgi:hypothetical protein
MLHQSNWRKDDEVTFGIPKKGKLIGKISKVLPREVTIQFKGKAANDKVLHADDNLKRFKLANLSSQCGDGYGQHTRSERTVEIKARKCWLNAFSNKLNLSNQRERMKQKF